MRRMSDTIARLAAIRTMKERMAQTPVDDRLADLEPFGSNPGALKGRSYVPRGAARGRPLVVVLHGCTQTAAHYDHGSGWSRLADEAGFALLFAEQAQANNLNRCFNWFEPGDIGRDRGEALSIRQMIDHMVAREAVDRDRIYVTGLSAGGAMAAVMLADYPELFAGGAIIAGLPYGVAGSIPEAFDAMRAHGLPEGPALRRLLPAAERPASGWPTVSVWHGTGDRTVGVANADAVIEQWRGRHGVGETPDERQQNGREQRRLWRDASGRVVLEQVLISGMGHGTPIDATGPEPLGEAAPFMLDVGIASTRAIALRWGIAEPQAAMSIRPAQQAGSGARSASPAGTRNAARPVEPDEVLLTDRMPERDAEARRSGASGTATSGDGRQKPAQGIRKVIEDALRQAGLM